MRNYLDNDESRPDSISFATQIVRSRTFVLEMHSRSSSRGWEKVGRISLPAEAVAPSSGARSNYAVGDPAARCRARAREKRH